MASYVNPPFLSYPTWKKKISTRKSAQAVVDCDCGCVEALLYDASHHYPFIGRKLEGGLGRDSGFLNVPNAFPTPLFNGKHIEMFADAFWTPEDILKKYGREVDLAVYDYMDRELDKWNEFRKCPLEMVVQSDRELRKMWTVFEASTLTSSADDPQYLASCLALSCLGPNGSFTVALGNGAKCGLLRLFQLQPLQQSTGSGLPEFQIKHLGKVKFSDMICQLQLDSESDFVVCRTESGLYVCPLELLNRSLPDSSELVWMGGLCRSFTLSPHVSGEVALLDHSGKVKWGNVNRKDVMNYCSGERMNPNDSKLCCWSDHPRLIYIDGVSGVQACDLRGSLHSFCSFEGEKVGAIGGTVLKSLVSVATDKRLMIFDDRRPNIPVLSWCHSLIGGMKFLNSGSSFQEEILLSLTQRLFNETVFVEASNGQVSNSSLQYLTSLLPIFRLKNTSDAWLWLKQHTDTLFWPVAVKRRVAAAIRGSCMRKISNEHFLFTASDCGDLYCQKLPDTTNSERKIDGNLAWKHFSNKWSANLERLASVCSDSSFGCKTYFRPSFSCIDVRELLLRRDTQKLTRRGEVASDRIFGGASHFPDWSRTDCWNCNTLGSCQSRIRQKNSVRAIKHLNLSNSDHPVTDLILNAWNNKEWK